MRTKHWLKGVVLCVMVCVLYADAREQKTRRKRCRCKKYIEQIKQDMDDRLSEFESKIAGRFEKYLIKSGNLSEGDISEIYSMQKIDSLVMDMNRTRKTLQKESYSLRRLQETMYSQEVNVDVLTNNFKTLDAIVRNLTTVVEKLEETVRHSMTKSASKTSTSDKAKRKVSHSSSLTPNPAEYPRDCDEVYQSGGMRYLGDYYIMVQPEGGTKPFKTVCKIIDGAGWTVIQRRQDGSENFSRDWREYSEGFGDLQNEFWIGNEQIHLLTSQDNYELKIDMEDWDGKTYYAEYNYFRVEDEANLYRLHVNGYHGTAGDSLTPYWRSHDGMPFSTRDKDNDNRFYDNCAEHYTGGWWYNDCFESHLNGKYYQNGSHNNYFVRNGIQWNAIHSYSSLKFVEMMIKPVASAEITNNV